MGSDGISEVTVVEFRLQDPCDPPESLTAPTIIDQTYTLGDVSATPYTHPDFVIVPDYCGIEYSYNWTSLTDSDGNTGTAISRSDKTFSFFFDDDFDDFDFNQNQRVEITASSIDKYGYLIDVIEKVLHLT